MLQEVAEVLSYDTATSRSARSSSTSSELRMKPDSLADCIFHSRGVRMLRCKPVLDRGDDYSGGLAQRAAERVMRRNHPKVKKRIFALASGWGPNPVREFYEKLEKDPAWTVRTIECGHDAMLDEPEEVVNILREAAEITLTKF